MAYGNSAEERRGGASRRKIPGWVIGMAVTLGVIVLAVVGLFIAGSYFVRDTLGGFEQADTSMERMVESFGPIAEFRPDPSGVIPPERVETFLATRERVAPARDRLEQSLSRLSGEDRVDLIRKTIAGFGLLGQTSDFITQRNDALRDSSMGFGEYYYVYALAYYSWLGKAPADGPSFKFVNEQGYVLDEAFQGTPEDEVVAARDEQVRTSLNRLLLPLLKNQLADLVPGDDQVEAWRRKLQVEIDALEANTHRIPWEDGVPEEITTSLDTYRDRIDEVYRPMCNALEVGLARR